MSSSPLPAGIERMVGDLHVEVRGSGRPILLIHGNSGDLHYFDRNVPILAKQRRVVAMDCRGQGRSARGVGPLTLARMADDAADVIRDLGAGTDAGPEPFDVLGFSDGANVAMLLALRHPELVASLVLASGNIGAAGMRFGVRWGLRLLALPARFARRIPKRARRYELLRLMLDSPGMSLSDLAHIDVPTLVLAGQRDLIRRPHTRALAEAIPKAALWIVPGGSHTVLRDRADEVTPEIVRFLSGALTSSAL